MRKTTFNGNKNNILAIVDHHTCIGAKHDADTITTYTVGGVTYAQAGTLYPKGATETDAIGIVFEDVRVDDGYAQNVPILIRGVVKTSKLKADAIAMLPNLKDIQAIGE